MTRLALSFDPGGAMAAHRRPGRGAGRGAGAAGVAARVRGVALRALASALLVAALTNPVLQREEREPLPGVVAVVVDKSGSQRLGSAHRADRGRLWHS